jgi:hypothetical protein
MEKYGVPNPLCLEENQVYGKAQKEIQDWLQALGLVFKSDYSVLKKKQIDLFNDDLKLGIEYCGLFWHNEVSPTPRDSRYHYRKYKACNENGVSLITIFEDEWTLNKNKCKDILKGILGIYDIRLYARKCSVSLIDKKQLRDFCEANHIQGSNKRAIVCFGLFYDQELMGVMSLGYHPRNTIKDVIVLDRMCFKNGIQVVGGASKLFKQCATWAVNNSYKSIVTWSDNRWSDGKVYDILGFDLDKKLPPDYSYVNLHNVRPGRTSKQSQRKLLTGCPKDKTEHEFALENGFARIWDCGKKRWIFNL